MKKYPLNVLDKSFSIDPEQDCKTHSVDNGNKLLFGNMGQTCPNFKEIRQNTAGGDKKGITKEDLHCLLKTEIESMRLKGRLITSFDELLQVLREYSLYRTRVLNVLENANPECPLLKQFKAKILEVCKEAEGVAS